MYTTSTARMKLLLLLPLLFALIPSSKCQLSNRNFQSSEPPVPREVLNLLDQMKNLNNATVKFWNTKVTIANLKLFQKNNPGKLQDLLRFVQGKSEPHLQRAKKRIELVQKLDGSKGTIINNIKANKDDLALGIELEEMLEKKHGAVNYTDFDVRQLGIAIFSINPTFLGRMEGTARNELLRIVTLNVKEPGRLSDEKEVKNAKKLQKLLLKTQITDEKLEKLTDFDEIPFEALTARQVRLLPANIVSDNRRRNSIISICKNDCNLDKQRAALELMLKHDKVIELTAGFQAYSKIEQYGELKKSVVRTDLAEEVLTDEDVLDRIERNERDFKSKGRITTEGRRKARNQCKQFKDGLKFPDRDSFGIMRFGSCPFYIIRKTIVNKAITVSDVKDIVKNVENEKGIGRAPKMLEFAGLIKDTFTDGARNLKFYRSYPVPLLKFLPTFAYAKVTDLGEVENLLLNQDEIEFDNQKIALLLPRTKGGFERYGKVIREQIPIVKLVQLGTSDLKSTGKGTSSLSATALITNREGLKDVVDLDINNWDVYKDFLSIFSRDVALKFKNENIEELAIKINQEELSSTGCLIVKEKYVAKKKEDMKLTSDIQVFKQMDIIEFSKLPPCLITSVGKEALTVLEQEKQILLMRKTCENDDASKSISRSVMVPLTNLGLRGMKIVGGLPPFSSLLLGRCLFFVAPGYLINIATKETAEEIVDAVNELAEEGICMQKEFMDAMANLIVKGKGAPNTWKDPENKPACLLHVLSRAQLDRIPPETLASLNCEMEMMSPSTKQLKERTCANDVEGYEKMNEAAMKKLKSAQMKAIEKIGEATTTRRKRATAGEDTCDKAALHQTLDQISSSELDKMTPEEAFECDALGIADMALAKALLLMGKITRHIKKITPNIEPNMVLNNLDAKVITRLGCMLKGAHPNQLINMTEFDKDGEFDEAIWKLGRCDWTAPAARDTYIKHLEKRKTLDQMNDIELVTIGPILCHFRKEEIAKINPENSRKIIGTIGEYEDCRLEALQELFKVMEKTNAYGDKKNWDDFTVREVNVITVGIAPEDISKLKPSAIGGLSPLAIQRMPPDYLKALSEEQAKYLTAEQINSMERTRRANLPASIISRILPGAEESAAVRKGLYSRFLLMVIIPMSLWIIQ